jgi:hypothetical protein
MVTDFQNGNTHCFIEDGGKLYFEEDLLLAFDGYLELTDCTCLFFELTLELPNPAELCKGFTALTGLKLGFFQEDWVEEEFCEVFATSLWDNPVFLAPEVGLFPGAEIRSPPAPFLSSTMGWILGRPRGFFPFGVGRGPDLFILSITFAFFFIILAALFFHIFFWLGGTVAQRSLSFFDKDEKSMFGYFFANISLCSFAQSMYAVTLGVYQDLKKCQLPYINPLLFESYNSK